MTREEAIDVLHELWITKYGETPECKVRQAIDMAIKVLEQELCDNAVSRQAVIDITWEEPSYTDALNVLTEVRDKVKALPSVNPQEPKTGHWIWNYDKGYCKCSECGIGMGHTEFDYCPNCGAKMVEPQESEE